MNSTLPSKKDPSPALAVIPFTSSQVPLRFRPYQLDAFQNRSNGIECWLWGRQTGKSFTLAAWAIDRLLTRPGRLVTILSNSRANGMELNFKCAQICELQNQIFEQADLSPNIHFESMNYETRLHSGSKTSRIKVLPANPRTARGFSGDLILDEFAFHEQSQKIWEAAEPILSANPDYLCRIASTPNGRHNMFYQLATTSGILTRRVPRSLAWTQGLPIFHPVTRQPITPLEARELALDKAAYDQNYECLFNTENMALLTLDLISQAESSHTGFICQDHWSPSVLAFLRGNPPPGFPTLAGPLYAGIDVGRTRDWTVITVIEKLGNQFLVRAILRLRNLPLPDQQERLAHICSIPAFRRACIDMTGLGLGLFEYSRVRFGSSIHGIDFARSLPLPSALALDASHPASVHAPELLALQLLRAYTDRAIKHPIDPLLRDDLRRPERQTSPSGRVCIAADRHSGGHADHFWSLALAIHAAQSPPANEFEVIPVSGRLHFPRHTLV